METASINSLPAEPPLPRQRTSRLLPCPSMPAQARQAAFLACRRWTSSETQEASGSPERAARPSARPSREATPCHCRHDPRSGRPTRHQVLPTRGTPRPEGRHVKYLVLRLVHGPDQKRTDPKKRNALVHALVIGLVGAMDEFRPGSPDTCPDTSRRALPGYLANAPSPSQERLPFPYS